VSSTSEAVSYEKCEMYENIGSAPAETTMEEPLDLRTHTSTVESDTAEQVLSIAKDVTDLCVQDLLLADDHQSRVQLTQASKEGMKNSQGEDSDDGRFDFDILSQDFDCSSGVLEREDAYIYDSQPCKYNSTQSTTAKPTVEPRQHSATRRSLNVKYSSADVSPTKRRYQETQ